MNPLLSTQLGTRHRAGIGITEETDAIAVICSEETGAISVAVGGRIDRDLSVEQLRDRLGAELRRHMTPAALPTPITQNLDDESDAALPSPFTEPAPNRKSEQGPQSGSL
jgi:diadenylate cyclase